MRKVVCVGFQKTGTSSLGVALEDLGYSVAGYWDFRDMAMQENLHFSDIEQRAMALAESHDAFKDTPWPLLYKQLDKRFPGSKFLLVIRDSDKWIKSAVSDFGDFHNEIHQLIYGVGYPKGNEQIWIDRYEQHNAEVMDYFSGRSEDLLVLYMDRGEVNWKNLCDFLGKPVPDKGWPHANKIKDKKNMLLKQHILNKLKFWR